jgi:hypothetical protein
MDPTHVDTLPLKKLHRQEGHNIKLFLRQYERNYLIVLLHRTRVVTQQLARFQAMTFKIRCTPMMQIQIWKIQTQITWF